MESHEKPAMERVGTNLGMLTGSEEAITESVSVTVTVGDKLADTARVSDGIQNTTGETVTAAIEDNRDNTAEVHETNTSTEQTSEIQDTTGETMTAAIEDNRDNTAEVHETNTSTEQTSEIQDTTGETMTAAIEDNRDNTAEVHETNTSTEQTSEIQDTTGETVTAAIEDNRDNTAEVHETNTSTEQTSEIQDTTGETMTAAIEDNRDNTAEVHKETKNTKGRTQNGAEESRPRREVKNRSAAVGTQDKSEDVTDMSARQETRSDQDVTQEEPTRLRIRIRGRPVFVGVGKGPGPASGSSQPPQPFYTAQMPPYPGPHFGLQSGVLGPGPGHSPPPPGPTQHFHKDERTQRQYIKLKKKLEQKHQQTGLSSPPYSPRKEHVNGLKMDGSSGAGSGTGTGSGGKGMNSVGTSEDGEESSRGEQEEEEDDEAPIVELLSSVTPPTVVELLSRSALLSWSALSEADKNSELYISEPELVYEVLLADTAKGGKYRSIYNGPSLSCKIEDLRPGSEYSVCLKVHLDELQGTASEPKFFTTPACPPDQPLPPKLITRNKNSIQLRWNAPADNGSHITCYVLEWDEGKAGGFVELFRNKSKQHNMVRLQPATSYRFRLSAVNECGRSSCSEVVTYSTSGSPPPQPSPPSLLEAAVTSLGLVWEKRPVDEDFTLQMDDLRTGHGFLPVYNGKDTCYRVDKLARHSDYKFRVRAQNEEGPSGWSEQVTYRTLPSRPAPPSKPAIKGKILAHSFKVKWEPPNDRGGTDLTCYLLELNTSKGFEVVHEGLETECSCDRLSPGTSYQVRVSSRGPGGTSDPSEPLTVTTDPVCPGPCGPPRLHGRPRPHSLTLKFSYPDYNGGAAVTDLEVEMTAPDASKRLVHHGPETECVVNELSPGQPYLFHVRAHNKAGVGPWSEGVEVLSGAAAPDAPLPPLVTCRNPHSVLVTWTPPSSNGAPLTDYKVEMCISATDKEEDASGTSSTSSSGNPLFTTAYHGPNSSCEVKGLAPNTCYGFHVQATNSAGASDSSELSLVRTPPSAPGVVGSLRYSATPTSLALSWLAPSNHGSNISHYNVDLGDKILTSLNTECTINFLRPETNYRIRVQAVNAVGAGPFSTPLKTFTLPLPPLPPHLECTNTSHNFLKLKWGDGRNVDFTNYNVEMENPRSGEFQCVYQGTSHSCKVSRLQELTSYTFRVCAINDAGQGDYSETCHFTTGMAPPPPIKGLRASEVTQRTCVLEWLPCRLNVTDPVLYHVQICRVRDQEYKQVHRGPDTKVTISDLEPGADYYARVCPVRVADSGELMGVSCAPAAFSTLAASPQAASDIRLRTVTQVTENKQFTDQQWAIIILSCFSLFAVLVAVLMQQFIDWGARN